MNRIFTVFTMFALLITQTSTVLADADIKIGAVKITGGGLELLGTVSTWTLNDSGDAKRDRVITYVGWGLIVAGLLVESGDVAVAAPAPHVYSGQTMFKSMVREARVVQEHPELVNENLPIVDGARKLGLSTNDTAKVVLALDRLSKQPGMTPASAKLELQREQLNLPRQSRSVDNLIALSLSTI